MNIFFAIILIFILCIVGVIADYFLKVAGEGAKFIEPKPFIFGFVIYASTAIGWFLILKYLRLAEVGLFYSIFMMILLAAMGVFMFNEQLNVREYVGLGLGIVSLLLMSRFL